ncbi:MAG: helix-turn-helix transcriptional regulator, partial [Casimicrobium sp.]
MRVLTVLELLQSRECITGGELAQTLEVHVRTVQRYIARLQDLGIPVESTRGPGGAYRLRAGFRLPPMMFSTEEAFALALGLDALTYLGLEEIEPATAGAKAKLERVLPTFTTKRVNAIRDALLVERPRFVVNASTKFLIELAQATSNHHCLNLTYQARDGDATQRTV